MEWIKVEDRLPELGVIVLLTDMSSVYAGKRVSDSAFPYNFIEQDFDKIITDLEEENSFNSFVSWAVTHWMPLPSPPKED